MSKLGEFFNRIDSRFSIRFKVITGIILVFFFTGASYLVFQYISSTHTASIKDDEIIQIYTNVQHNTENSLKNSVSRIIDGMATSGAFTEALASNDMATIKVLAEGNFLNFETTANVAILAVYSADMKLLSFTGAQCFKDMNGSEIDPADLKAMAQKAKKSFAYEGSWLSLNGNPTLAFITSVLDNDDRTIGYVFAGMHRKVFFRVFTERLGKIGVMANNKCELKDEKFKEIVETLNGLKGGMASKSNMKSFIFDHKKKIMKAHLIDVTSITGKRVGRLVVADDYTSLYKRINLLRIISAGLIGGVLIGSLVVFSFMMTRLLRPLKTLDYSLRDFATGRGDLTVQLEIVSFDEFGKVSNHFNEFVANLRSMILNIANVTHNLAASSMELSSSAMSFADNATRQTDVIRNARSSMDIIAQKSEAVMDRARTQGEVTREIGDFVIAIMQSVQEIIGQMKTYMDQSVETADKIRSEQGTVDKSLDGMKKMSESSGKIREIVSIINDISEQINLLSLNASIEAARAGEQGRGFAVVADEVSKLADQTASSTKEIEALIEEMVREVADEEVVITSMAQSLQHVIGSIESISTASRSIHDQLNQHAGNADKVITSSRQLITSLDEVEGLIQEQHTSIMSTNDNMKGLDETALTISAGAEELSSTSEEIASNSEKLKELIDEFKV